MTTPEHHDDLFDAAAVRAQAAASEIHLSADQIACQTSSAPRAAADIGACLKAARQARGLSLRQCGQSLHLPTRVLERLESGDFGDAGQYVFTRGAVASYARLLGVPSLAAETSLRQAAPAPQPTALVTSSNANAPRRRFLLQRYGAAATYFVLTATVAVPLVWLGLRGGLDNQLTRIAPLDSAPAASVAQPGPSTQHPQRDEAPLLASMTPFTAMNLDAAAASPVSDTNVSAPNATPNGHMLSLHANADSWVEVINATGDTLESDVLHAGDTRSYHSTTPLSVTLGNADAVDVSSDGNPMSTTAFRHANVARFKVFDSAPGNG